jgi:hypothetical protein
LPISSSIFQYDRKRPIVHKRHLHRRAENAMPDLVKAAPALFYEILVQFFREGGTGGGCEARPVALSAIGVQSELGHDQYITAYILNRQIRFSVLIGEDTKWFFPTMIELDSII